ncbi:aKG-HExxH-type peptide beta-hydroxylase [Spirosoma montaniterrae]|uniref:HEXXH motif domain-containing protein n=1 Tax=Spirosoma montaniterrae TaxID=1178516 RepID=A0A1P9WU10_9BACT|nr:HEXXH motif-containing putative peptide modification protein [Spirosoma montaniterrae]AQG78828.1 hypothetical protein AWR27_05520 [Spirosoma montaniterrae]
MKPTSPRPQFEALARQGDAYLGLLWKNLLLNEPMQSRLRQYAGTADLLDTVMTLPVHTVVAQGTPFFWETVCRLLSTDDDPQWADDQQFLLHLIDSFSDVVDTPFSVQIPLDTAIETAATHVVILPKRRLMRKLTTPAELHGSAGSLQLIADGADCPFMRGTVMLASGYGNVLAVPELFYPDIAPKINESALHSCARQVMAGLTLIRQYDAALAGQIRALIRYYVPVHPQQARQHHSFTTSAYPGVIFLSESDNVLLLAETIVHEFAHTELDRITAFSPIHYGTPDAVYYSPWRPDARPLTGLFHAVYVFFKIYEWFEQIDAATLLPNERAYLHQRREQVYWRLRIGMAQVPATLLHPICRDLLTAMQQRLNELDPGGLFSQSLAFATLMAHFRAWQASHPQYAATAQKNVEYAGIRQMPPETLQYSSEIKNNLPTNGCFI